MSGSWYRRLGILFVIAWVAVSCGGDSLSADAGADFAVAVGESPEFDGCASTGDIDQYEWIIRQAPGSDPDAVDTTLSADQACTHLVDSMTVDDVGSWTIELIVTDAQGASSNDEVTVSVTQ